MMRAAGGSRGGGVKPGIKNAPERIKPIIARIRKRFPEARCALDHQDPLQLLVATILSADVSITETVWVVSAVT